MRIALFGEGRSGAHAREALRAEHDVTFYVPRRRGHWLRRLVRGERAIARGDLATMRVNADLVCIAGFPWILPPRLLDVARHGAINVHPSLLPRHRGPLPFFWIYHSDDRETGVTVHRATAQLDAGGILAQSRFALPRGFPVEQLAEQKRRAAAELLRDVVARIDLLECAPQDEASMTWAPRVKRGTRMIDFGSWPAERVWHFLRGLHPYFREPLGIDYRGVGAWEPRPHDRAPGTVEASSNGWVLYCRDGIVELQ